MSDEEKNKLDDNTAGLKMSPAVSYEKPYRLVSLGFLLGIASSVFMVIGVFAPAIDFSVFNPSVNLQYNLLKICKNIGLISSMWKAIPEGFFIAAAMMLILSFVKIPTFRIIPCMLAIAMIVLMAFDIGNVLDWIRKVLEGHFETGAGGVNIGQVIKSMMCGIYFLVAGIVTGIVSIFFK
jgi:hypothetical protein